MLRQPSATRQSQDGNLASEVRLEWDHLEVQVAADLAVALEAGVLMREVGLAPVALARKGRRRAVKEHRAKHLQTVPAGVQPAVAGAYLLAGQMGLRQVQGHID